METCCKRCYLTLNFNIPLTSADWFARLFFFLLTRNATDYNKKMKKKMSRMDKIILLRLNRKIINKTRGWKPINNSSCQINSRIWCTCEWVLWIRFRLPREVKGFIAKKNFTTRARFCAGRCRQLTNLKRTWNKMALELELESLWKNVLALSLFHRTTERLRLQDNSEGHLV